MYFCRWSLYHCIPVHTCIPVDVNFQDSMLCVPYCILCHGGLELFDNGGGNPTSN